MPCADACAGIPGSGVHSAAADSDRAFQVFAPLCADARTLAPGGDNCTAADGDGRAAVPSGNADAGACFFFSDNGGFDMASRNGNFRSVYSAVAAQTGCLDVITFRGCIRADGDGLAGNAAAAFFIFKTCCRIPGCGFDFASGDHYFAAASLRTDGRVSARTAGIHNPARDGDFAVGFVIFSGADTRCRSVTPNAAAIRQDPSAVDLDGGIAAVIAVTAADARTIRDIACDIAAVDDNGASHLIFDSADAGIPAVGEAVDFA